MKGENAVTNKTLVLNLRIRAAAGESGSSLAREFRISAETVRRIIRGDTWASAEFWPTSQSLAILAMPEDELAAAAAASQEKLLAMLGGQMEGKEPEESEGFRMLRERGE